MKTRRNSPTTRGFTLIELMVVIAILGILVTVVAKEVLPYLARSKQVACEAKIETLKTAIDSYRMNHNEIPDTLEVLIEDDEALAGGKYLKNEDSLMDPWGVPFNYQKESRTKYRIVSFGADGLEGGTGEDTDISSDGSKSKNSNF